MERFVEIAFPAIVAAGFAALYVLRIHFDYHIHVQAVEDLRTVAGKNTWEGRDLVRHWRHLLIVGLLGWLAHAAGIATSEEMNRETIRILTVISDETIGQLRGILSVKALIVLLIVFVAYEALQRFLPFRESCSPEARISSCCS
jgi:hypothetical protein